MDSFQGKLLVSSPALIDPNFRKTVVLIAHHDEEGAMGLVLSRPSDVAAVDALPLLAGIPGADEPVFVGGPVQPEAFMALADALHAGKLRALLVLAVWTDVFGAHLDREVTS